MGLFKRKKNFNIELKQDISGYLVFPFHLKNDIVLLNHKAIVPENSLLAFATRGRVLDYLPTGEHVVHPVSLPNCNKKHKLQKTDKTGALPTGFYGYVYYINLNEVKNLMFGTYRKLRYANNDDGKFKVKLKFAIDLKISEPDKLMKALLRQFAYLRAGESEEIVESWLSEYVTDNLQKMPLTKAQFAKNEVDVLVRDMSEDLFKMLSNIGLELIDLRVLEVELPNRKKANVKNPLFVEVQDESYTMINNNHTPIKKQEIESQEQNNEITDFENEINHIKIEKVENNAFENDDNTDETTWKGWEKFLNKSD